MVQWWVQCKVERVCLCCQCISPPFSVQSLGAHIVSSAHIPDCSQVPSGGTQLGSCSRRVCITHRTVLSPDRLYKYGLYWLHQPLCRTVSQCHPRTLAHNTPSQHVLKIPLWWLQLSLLLYFWHLAMETHTNTQMVIILPQGHQDALWGPESPGPSVMLYGYGQSTRTVRTSQAVPTSLIPRAHFLVRSAKTVWM